MGENRMKEMQDLICESLNSIGRSLMGVVNNFELQKKIIDAH